MDMNPNQNSKSNIIKELWRKKRFTNILLALSFMALSIVMMVVPNPVVGLMIYPEFSTDMTNVKWIVSPSLFLFCLYCIIKEVRSDYEITNCKCIDCGRIKVSDISKKPMCSACGGSLERLEGFFDRHPEFKKNDDQ